MKCYSVFYILLANIANNNSYAHQIILLLLTVTITAYHTWTIIEILDSHIYYRRLSYLVILNKFEILTLKSIDATRVFAIVNLSMLDSNRRYDYFLHANLV
jgi:signal recognition particle receptor subunit beta